MRSDINGCSTCPKGQEHYQEYYSAILRKDLIQYDYRTPEGELFSCIAPTVEIARKRRDNWLKQKETV